MSKVAKKGIQRAGTGGEMESSRPTRALSPFGEIDRLFDRWFENLSSRGWPRLLHRDWPARGELTLPFEGRMPKVDVIDRDNEVVVRAEVPGVEKDDLEISVSDNSVTIKGETKHEAKEEKGDYYRCEMSRGSFSRTVALPDYVDRDGAKAKFKGGVLELTLPKVEKAKRRNIKIE